MTIEYHREPRYLKMFLRDELMDNRTKHMPFHRTLSKGISSIVTAVACFQSSSPLSKIYAWPSDDVSCVILQPSKFTTE